MDRQVPSRCSNATSSQATDHGTVDCLIVRDVTSIQATLCLSLESHCSVIGCWRSPSQRQGQGYRTPQERTRSGAAIHREGQLPGRSGGIEYRSCSSILTRHDRGSIYEQILQVLPQEENSLYQLGSCRVLGVRAALRYQS